MSFPLLLQPGGPSGPLKSIVNAAVAAAQHAARNPIIIFTVPTAAYTSGMLGHTIPHFHEIARKKGYQPAATYLVDAFIRGNITPNAGLDHPEMHFLRDILTRLPAKEKKQALITYENMHGLEKALELKRKIGYRGGGDIWVEPKWLHIYTKVYFLSLVFCFLCVFVPAFFSYLNNEIETNPSLKEKFYFFYLDYFLPYGYKVNKENCLIVSPFITDDCYLLNVE